MCPYCGSRHTEFCIQTDEGLSDVWFCIDCRTYFKLWYVWEPLPYDEDTEETKPLNIL